jgi:hypothetical protein
LLGCRDGYGFANSARQALAAITGWFNDPINGAARRAQILEVDLVIPLNDASDAGLIEDAWRRAWEWVQNRTAINIRERLIFALVFIFLATHQVLLPPENQDQDSSEKQTGFLPKPTDLLTR